MSLVETKHQYEYDEEEASDDSYDNKGLSLYSFTHFSLILAYCQSLPLDYIVSRLPPHNVFSATIPDPTPGPLALSLSKLHRCSLKCAQSMWHGEHPSARL